MEAQVPKECDGQANLNSSAKGISVQLVLSLSLGVSAFLGFCVSPVPATRPLGRPR